MKSFRILIGIMMFVLAVSLCVSSNASAQGQGQGQGRVEGRLYFRGTTMVMGRFLQPAVFRSEMEVTIVIQPQPVQ